MPVYNGKSVFLVFVKDGADLSPPILLDVNEDLHLPSNKGSYLCAQEGMTVVRQFLEQFHQLYDSDNREPLLSAYHPEAMFSITSAYPPGHSSALSPK
jgi:nuclear RNA export factor